MEEEEASGGKKRVAENKGEKWRKKKLLKGNSIVKYKVEMTLYEAGKSTTRYFSITGWLSSPEPKMTCF
ncbi:hypothetical protein RJT34_30221 [Clitoria ternatea]|uniref:Uncharacterized protein n=1 Tax=Clitoria ternatea TaxID=43366 RepID=A0AAN9I754_CLITE